MNIYNALYARGTFHNSTTGMAHEKQVEKPNSTWWTAVCFRDNAIWHGDGPHVQLHSGWSRSSLQVDYLRETKSSVLPTAEDMSGSDNTENILAVSIKSEVWWDGI